MAGLKHAFGRVATRKRNPLVSSPLDMPFHALQPQSVRAGLRGYGYTLDELSAMGQTSSAHDAQVVAQSIDAAHASNKSKVDVNALIGLGTQLIGMFGSKAPPAAPPGSTPYVAPPVYAPPAPAPVDSGLPWWLLPLGIGLATLGVGGAAFVISQQPSRRAA